MLGKIKIPITTVIDKHFTFTNTPHIVKKDSEPNIISTKVPYLCNDLRNTIASTAMAATKLKAGADLGVG